MHCTHATAASCLRQELNGSFVFQGAQARCVGSPVRPKWARKGEAPCSVEPPAAPQPLPPPRPSAEAAEAGLQASPAGEVSAKCQRNLFTEVCTPWASVQGTCNTMLTLRHVPILLRSTQSAGQQPHRHMIAINVYAPCSRGARSAAGAATHTGALGPPAANAPARRRGARGRAAIQPCR